MDNLKEKGPKDRNRISLSEDWEVKWWTKRYFGRTIKGCCGKGRQLS